jgi:hypothetical protein
VLIDELRRRIQAIQEAMERDGRTDVMAAVESIMEDVGLTGVMKAKKVHDLEKVFDRLYRDAMERLDRRGRLEMAMGALPSQKKMRSTHAGTFNGGALYKRQLTEGTARREAFYESLPPRQASEVREHVEGRAQHWKCILNTQYAEREAAPTLPANWAKRTGVEMKQNVTEAKSFAVPRPWNAETSASQMPQLRSRSQVDPTSSRRGHPLRATDAFERFSDVRAALTESMPEILSVNRLNGKANASARAGLHALS